MPDVDNNAATAPVRKRRLPTGWLALTAALLIVLFITWLHGVLQTKHLTANYEKRIDQLTAQHAADMQEALKTKGTAVALALQMANPYLLTEDGQKNTQSYFSALLKSDPSIAYVVLYDSKGKVCATTDLRFARESGAKLTDKLTVREGSANGIAFDITGPIVDEMDTLVGAVRVGVSSSPIPAGK